MGQADRGATHVHWQSLQEITAAAPSTPVTGIAVVAAEEQLRLPSGQSSILPSLCAISLYSVSLTLR